MKTRLNQINIIPIGRNRLYSFFIPVFLIFLSSSFILSEQNNLEITPKNAAPARSYESLSYIKRFRPLENFGFIHIIPLEAIIGRLYLGSQKTPILSSYMEQGKNSFIKPEAIQNDISGILPAGSLRLPDSHLHRQRTIKIYRVSYDSIFSIDLYQIKSHDSIGNSRYGDKLFGSITMGYSFGKNHFQGHAPVNLLFGISSIYSTTERKDLVEILGTDYGTVFFVPGLQISRESVIFQAMLELPVYRMNPENAIYQQQDLKANIGMKYILK
ncbi:MAG: hypothetical protein OEZ34_07230 [Spirochaetia bacterium]|nr:hypothetical protein [Spirochaetia bacterium]